jgi:succinate dehydrogenase / fumarate reductase cytochrome b subunit
MTTQHTRPISPHLQVYKLPITGIISITHRMTGVMLSAGFLLFLYILCAVAGGGDSYLEMQDVMNVWIMKLVVFGFAYALFFHLVHGIRHLFWDTGMFFEKETLHKLAVAELVASLVLTLITYIGIHYGL